MASHIRAVVKGFDDEVGDMINVYNFYNDEYPAGLAANIITNCYTPIAAQLSTHFHIDVIEFATWSGPSNGEWWELGADGKKKPKAAPPWGVAFPQSVTPGFVGTDATDKLPPQSAPYIYLKTSIPRVIGKKYFGDFCEDTQAGGVLTVAADTALSTVETNLRNRFSGLEIWGPIHGFQVPTGATIGRVLGSQRRRKWFVGS